MELLWSYESSPEVAIQRVFVGTMKREDEDGRYRCRVRVICCISFVFWKGVLSALSRVVQMERGARPTRDRSGFSAGLKQGESDGADWWIGGTKTRGRVDHNCCLFWSYKCCRVNIVVFFNRVECIKMLKYGEFPIDEVILGVSLVITNP